MIVTKTVCQAMSVYRKCLWEGGVIFHKILTDYKERNSFLRSVITYFAVCFSCQIWADGKTLKFLLCGCVGVLFLEGDKGFQLESDFSNWIESLAKKFRETIEEKF
ncbi:MAG: hypothetical protein ABF443_13345, partial [Acetobacter malorum]